MKRIFIASLTFLLAFIAVLFYMYKTHKPSKAILSINTSYSMVGKENVSMKIPLYFEEKNHEILDKTSVEEVLLSENKSRNKILVELLEIDFDGIDFFISKKYYKYSYIISFPNLMESFSLENVFLIIKTEKTSYQFSIGDVNYWYHEEYHPDLEITSLYGLTDNYKNSEMLSSLILSFSSPEIVKIQSISFLNSHVYLDLNELKEIVGEVNSVELQTKDFIEGYFPICEKKQSQNSIEIYSENKMIIPIYYSHPIYLRNEPIIIEYQIGEKDYIGLFQTIEFYTVSSIQNIPEMVEIFYDL